MKLTLREAKLWLLAGATACLALGHNGGEIWCLEAVAALSDTRWRRKLARENAHAAQYQAALGYPAGERDARILCFCAAVLRNVENGR